MSNPLVATPEACLGPVPGTLVPVAWPSRPPARVLTSRPEPDRQTPNPLHPRHVLQREVDALDSQLDDLDVMRGFADLPEALTAHGAEPQLPTETAVAEFGPGHFEINLDHVADAVRAAGRRVFADPDGRGRCPPCGPPSPARSPPLPTTNSSSPHGQSQSPLSGSSDAPLVACRGFDNRTVAVRIPAATGRAARLEHKVAGAAANP